MEKSLVTGGTGAVGFSVIEALLRRGRAVRALVRSVDKARRLLPEACELVPGDVNFRASVDRALDGCSVVYHAAGLPEQWLPDPGAFERVNAGGTRVMIEAALAARVTRFVHTSTIDVFAAARGASFDESVIDLAPKPTDYERSKQAADRAVAEAIGRGLPAIFIHPSAVYGPAPTGSPGMNDVIARFVKGELPLLLPGGAPLVFSRDQGEGQVLAAEKAEVGASYILSGEFVGFTDLVRAVAAAEGAGRRLPPVLPMAAARLVSAAEEVLARLTGRAPLIPSGQLQFLLWGARPSGAKARAELGWTTTPLAEGLRETLAFLRR